MYTYLTWARFAEHHIYAMTCWCEPTAGCIQNNTLYKVLRSISGDSSEISFWKCWIWLLLCDRENHEAFLWSWFVCNEKFFLKFSVCYIRVPGDVAYIAEAMACYLQKGICSPDSKKDMVSSTLHVWCKSAFTPKFSATFGQIDDCTEKFGANWTQMEGSENVPHWAVGPGVFLLHINQSLLNSLWQIALQWWTWHWPKVLQKRSQKLSIVSWTVTNGWWVVKQDNGSQDESGLACPS